MTHLKGVLMDFGDTLAYINWEEDERFRQEIVEVLEDHGYTKTLNEITPVLYDTYGSTTKGEARNPNEFWRIFLGNLGISGNLELMGKLEELRSRHFATFFKLFDGAIQVLSILKEKYKLALVSNCPVGLSDVVEAMGLVPFFESVVLSYEVRARKPDKLMYIAALSRLKLKPKECAFVADEIIDLEGARELGLKTILVRQGKNTTRDAKDPNFKPDFQCNHITEILQFL